MPPNASQIHDVQRGHPRLPRRSLTCPRANRSNCSYPTCPCIQVLSIGRVVPRSPLNRVASVRERASRRCGREGVDGLTSVEVVRSACDVTSCCPMLYVVMVFDKYIR